MYARLMSHLEGERGASMVEYSLLVLLIAIVALVAVTVAGGELSTAAVLIIGVANLAADGRES